MQLANQTFYFVLFSTFLGLLTSFYWGKRSQVDRYSSLYWPLGLGFYVVSSLAFFMSPWLGKINLTVANLSLLAGALSICLLFRVWSGKYGWSQRVVALVWFATMSALYLYLLSNGSTNDRIHLMNLAIGATSVWQIFTLYHLGKVDHSYQIKLLIIADLAQLFARISRSSLSFLQDNPIFPSLFQEDLFGFALRVLSGLTSMMVCILIANYYLEKLMQEHEKSAFAIEDGLLNSLNSLSMVRDNETGNHILRTKQYVETLARRLKSLNYRSNELSDDDIHDMTQAAPLHDIGKVGIPDAILKKNGPLDEDEWAIMKTHAALGEQVLKAAMVKDIKHKSVLEKAIQIAGGHHENWDGSGYPRGLIGESIPLSARIMSLADTYDALISERVYKRAWTHEEASAEICKLKGVRFDPMLVEAFLMDQQKFIEISSKYKDPA